MMINISLLFLGCRREGISVRIKTDAGRVRTKKLRRGRERKTFKMFEEPLLSSRPRRSSSVSLRASAHHISHLSLLGDDTHGAGIINSIINLAAAILVMFSHPTCPPTSAHFTIRVKGSRFARTSIWVCKGGNGDGMLLYRALCCALNFYDAPFIYN